MAGRKETVSDEEILRILLRSSDPFLSTTEVAEELGFSNSGVLKRLKPLADDGYLNSKSVGRGDAWWLTDDGRDFLSDEDE
ncbi:winged helix-turn-helix domain-containing protein [Halorubrum sp. BV1]|uniref:winged helix-turn-helix domain-containing protein n=1 Tax=Halorubrum sp. BV1 TaxID=1498500 RepID=UPI000679318D|nr:winged helix-turn-helix domain-containing protein [Halorubrum sp. BV1]